MYRISEEKESIATLAIKSGKSARTAADMAKINKQTAALIKRRLIASGEVSKNSRSSTVRDRGNYIKEWQLRTGMNQYQLLMFRERLRHSIALWLAKNKEPMPADKIHDAMRQSFPDVAYASVNQILHNNTDHVFRRVGERWTYTPSPFWFPGLFKSPSKWVELETARAIWFERNGLRDTLTEDAASREKERQEQAESYRASVAIGRAMPGLRFMATAGEIAKHYETNRETKQQ
jgi:hypothetical protein